MKVKVHCHGEFLITQLHLLTITYKFLIVPNAFQTLTSSVADSLENLD